MNDEQLSLFAGEDWPEKPRRTTRTTAPAIDAEQLPFDWDLPVALGPEDFFVSDSNMDAHAMVAGGLRWPEGKLALVGPEGSGKTHLVRIWQGLAGAERRDARELSPDLPAPGSMVAVEDLEALPRESETALFHLHNHLLATGGRLLLTSDRPPARWGVRLPDLASRMQATTVVRLEPPDDMLLEALIAKQFADRQLFPAPGVLAFVARRIERSHAAAAAAVAALDRASLSEGRRVSLALARRVLDSADSAP
ncbi:DnaA ATPase domain-containing protein [Rubellimicrobium roseum]|uniref:Chromosomal replication initiator DnaA n=1 Tax=Rubellimicrobium roseum TaxID=687525 RepID=A0A5C4NCN0_9RHOB|nr:DnaA/Hda family protein [Rubellimicrobium roseum]TNC71640.1 chromosomal replication initiator DnaA [Rubellimicrobium roseum]